MASGTIKKELTKAGTFTPSGSITSSLAVKQYGNVVSVHGWLGNVPLTANTDVTLGTLSNVSMPPDAVRTVAGVGANPYGHPADIAYLALGVNGSIIINSIVNGTRAVFFSFSYVANS